MTAIVTAISAGVSQAIQNIWYPDGGTGGHHGESQTHGHIHDNSHAHNQTATKKTMTPQEEMNIHMCLM